MVQKKINPTSSLKSFRSSNTVQALAEQLQSEAYLIPKIVKDMGQLVGLQADQIYAKWTHATFLAEFRDAYRELASTTAMLLDWYSVETISEEAVFSVGHRLAASVDPLVSLHARVDHLFRSYQQGENEHILDDAQKLWAALEFRAEALTGLTFAGVLKDV